MGMSLAEHLSWFYRIARQPNVNKYPIADVIDLLDRAEDFVNKRTKQIYGSSVFDSTDADVSHGRYSLATIVSDLLLDFIDDVYYSRTDSTERKRLEPTSIEELDIDNPKWREEDNSRPNKWAIDFQSRELIITPYEPVVSDGEDCIEARYRKKHTKMTRYYTTGKLTINNGSTDVLGIGTAFVGNIFAGDKIGIGKLLDQTHNTSFPVKWYTVATTPTEDTALTLTTAFAETSITSLDYISSSSSSINNEELNLCSVLMALSQAMYIEDNPDKQAKFQSDAVQRIGVEIGNIQDNAYENKESIIEHKGF
jgi:hypothetical protein